MLGRPYWTFFFDGVENLEVRNCHVDARRRASATTHDLYELTAFNTDGYDVTGSNVWIHDSSVWTGPREAYESMVYPRLSRPDQRVVRATAPAHDGVTS